MASGNKRLKIARYESIIAKDASNREALTQLGLLHESLEEYDKAIEFFERSSVCLGHTALCLSGGGALSM